MPGTTTRHHDIEVIGHDCIANSEIVHQVQLSRNVIKRQRICKICSRVWSTRETCKGFLTESTDKTQAKIMRIIDSVCKIFEVSRQDLLGTNRQRDLSLARQIAMYVAKRSGYSYPKIGEIFDRHHTTIIHGYRHVDEATKKDRRLEGLIEVLLFKDREQELDQ